MSVRLLGAVIVNLTISTPMSKALSDTGERLGAVIVNPYGSGDTLARVADFTGLEPPPVHLDENGWPQDFWATLGTVDEDFSLGDRNSPHERFDPVKGD
jgi:hypothetical protein